MQKEQVAKINSIISNPAMDRFTRAIQCLVLPEKLIAAHFNSLVSAAGEKTSNEEFQEAAKKFHFEVFKKNRDVKGDDQFAPFRDWLKSFEPLMKMNYESQRTEIKAKFSDLNKKLTLMTRKDIGTIRIDKLCNWLGNYKWCGDKDFFEIPGQYSGDFKPFVEQHVKVVRFEDTLKVFKSKQQPLELRILGSDGKTYNFIVKYGEDLRQDQRIQQVLALMSRQLLLDKNCKQNRLQIQTYQVVPITSNCGMLSVVQNVKTVNELLGLSGDGPLSAINYQIKYDLRSDIVTNSSGNGNVINHISDCFWRAINRPGTGQRFTTTPCELSHDLNSSKS